MFYRLLSGQAILIDVLIYLEKPKDFAANLSQRSHTMARGYQFNSFAQKLSLILGSAVIVGLSATMLVSFNSSKRLLESDVNKAAHLKVEAACKQVDTFAGTGAIMVRDLVSRQEAVGAERDPGRLAYMATVLKNTPVSDAYDIYISYEHIPWQEPGTGVSRKTWPKTMENSEDFRTQSWYADPKAAGHLMYTEPYVDPNEHVAMVSVVTPVVNKAGEFRGVAGVDFTLENLTELFSKLSLIRDRAAGDDFAFLVSKSGVLIAHPNKNLLMNDKSAGTNVSTLPGGKAILAADEGMADIVVNKKHRMIYWSTAPVTGWKACLEVSRELVYAPLTLLSKRMLLISLVSIIFLVVLIYITAQKIKGPLQQIVDQNKALRSEAIEPICDALAALERGDLTVKVASDLKPIQVDGRDEFAQAATECNAMISDANRMVASFTKAQTSLSQLIGQTQAAAVDIASSSSELASGNDDLARRTSEQAASLEETAASMEQMSGAVRQSADNARGTNALAANAREVAQGGGETIHKAVAAMDEITSCSRRIEDIITVIDEIAFQTNLLALNAAVEAARVGEQGRGFAVVASEVRSLAGRSSTAAKEIKSLVNETTAKVKDGTALVTMSGENLEEIVRAFNLVAGKVSEITSAAEEQAAGIDQVSKAVVRLDEITQQNAALVEEASAASRSMSHRAENLQVLVGQFAYDKAAYVDDDSDSDVRRPAPRLLAARAVGGVPVAAPEASTYEVMEF
ncbi:MAG TPA: methyl-accepting chemotaxis protein [Capsulimonadaceae bacterium]|jgi:methyl-accepting chemotaxis protein